MRHFSKDPGFWALPVYNFLLDCSEPVGADTVTMGLVKSEPISEASHAIIWALWRLVVCDWVVFRVCVDDERHLMEFAPWASNLTGVRLLMDDCAWAGAVR